MPKEITVLPVDLMLTPSGLVGLFGLATTGTRYLIKGLMLFPV